MCFLTFEQLLYVKLPQVYHLIIDEFQEEFYYDKVFALFPILRKATSVVAFSGSPIRKEHTSFLEGILSQSLTVSFPDIYPNTLREEVPYICMNMKAQINQLLKEVEKYRINAPVIVIGTEELATKYMNKVAQKKKVGVHLLFGGHCNAAELDQFLTT